MCTIYSWTDLHGDVTLVKRRLFEVSQHRWYHWKCIAFHDSKLTYGDNFGSRSGVPDYKISERFKIWGVLAGWFCSLA